MAYEIQKEDYLVSDDKQRLDITFIHTYLSNESYWAQNIPLEVVKRSIENSISFGVYHLNKQVGFARVTTDKATFAYLADVFMVESYRGKGLSRMLLEAIHAHPDVQGLRRWMLGTRDAHGLYEKYGWTSIPYPDRFMQLHYPDVYKNG